MKFKFKIQQYQTDAVENTVAVFTGQPSHGMAVYRIDPGKREKNSLTRRTIQAIATINWNWTAQLC
ncbi:MAG: hypothetical protein ACLUE0_01015 [Bacteroides uniformis]